MQKFRRVFEGIAKAGQSTDLNDFYTELFITERVSGEVNKEHEVRLIETASRKPAKDETPIKLEDIFKPLPGQDQPSRTIMTTGVAGIGKTILTHKFTLDWAEGKANQDIHFTLPFTFRELNLLKVKKFSLVELLHHFFIQTKGIRRYDLFQVVFILDGLDECRLPLDFKNNPIWTDVSKSTSVDVLLTNLIRGDLLPSARIWITTRPAAANQIPAECVDMVTEVRGFTDPQKEKYFRKRFREETLASTIISHIKTSRSLHIMCHIPLIREARENKGNLSVLWFDLENAFGSIPHKLVQFTLTKHHVPSRCRDLIADYYSNFRMRVSSGAITSSWHNVEIGIITGCTISVTLFSLAMNMLTKSAEPECRGPRTNSGQRQPPIRAFMDDLTVMTESVPGCRWILKGLEELVEWARQIQINGAEEREGGGQVPV
ncbi:hypothetical protein NHX12_015695 [Muraenolepis orangiensis]|uniref:NACHT domain-containing protein n=1 Tax=Muraenolepis orangiensis TaxID=630683 RepID=A0A9Q0I3I5_9TELE|nr:hypothetical protein NHX12_015695 [Muraenolepis orangiensis]